MKKDGFTLVELLAVIAILAILVIIALPNVINMYNSAKKQTFLTEARTIYKEAQKKYVSDSISGNNVNTISSNGNKLDLTGNKVDYDIKIDSAGNITDFKAYDGTYCISGKFNDISELNIDEVIEGECETKEEIIETISFEKDSWDTIVKAIKSGNTPNYKVGDTKEIDLGTYGKHTLRIANKSTPSECETANFSQSACGFVLEFADIITNHVMNETRTVDGGWPATSMRKYINNEIYNSLPENLRNSIIDTKVVTIGPYEGSNDDTSIEKIYLLALKEVYGYSHGFYKSSRQLDYYAGLNIGGANKKGVAKKYGTSNSHWWSRDSYIYEGNCFTSVGPNEEIYDSWSNDVYGVSPAFRIG